MNKEQAIKDGYYSKNGLIYNDQLSKDCIRLPQADSIANRYGYEYAERMVDDLEEYDLVLYPNQPPPSYVDIIKDGSTYWFHDKVASGKGNEQQEVILLDRQLTTANKFKGMELKDGIWYMKHRQY